MKACELSDCSSTFPPGARGPYAALCPEHRNKNGLDRLRSERGMIPTPPQAERPLLEVVREAAGQDPAERRQQRIAALLGVERATARVHRAEDELGTARRALRAASAAAVATSAAARHD